MPTPQNYHRGCMWRRRGLPERENGGSHTRPHGAKRHPTAVYARLAGLFECDGGTDLTAEEWIRTFAEEIGSTPPSPELMDEILRLASVAAHASERKAAPIACWLAATTGRPVSELRRIAERLPQGS
jgi:hypothetical protein